MADTGADGPRTTRRTLLGGVAAAGAGVAATGAAPPAAASAHDLRVMTRNLYVGVDLFELAGAADLEELREIAGRLLAEAREHPYRPRVEALADEVAASEPDVLGVQEAALVRTREPSEFDGEHDPGAANVLVDLLDLLEAALADRGLEYGVAASVVANDVEVPAATDDGDVDVRVTDRTALLVRADVDVADARADRYEASVPLPLDGTDLSLRRGFCRADLTVANESATVATTHLEAFDPAVRRDQAAELLERVPADRPVVLAGDVNSGPGGPTGAYDLLAESFEDAVATAGPGSDAHTCCHRADLRSDADALSSRVDVVLYRGRIEPTGAGIVGADPDSRVSVEWGGETVQVWPSDHAGVVASFELAVETAAVTSTPTGTPTPTGSPTSTEQSPVEQQPEAQTGFGWLLAIAGAVLAALGRRRCGR